MNDVSKNIKGLELRIAQIRTNLGLSQNVLADYIGMSRPNYTSIENEISGRFLKDYQLRILAEKLCVSSDYLLGLISDPNPNADIMAIIKVLGLSWESIKCINSLNSYHSDALRILDDFIKSFNFEFWELLNLYKKLKSFFDVKYSFVLQFTEEINFPQLHILDPNINLTNLANFNPNYKYFYYNLDDARRFFDVGKKILNNKNYSIDEILNKFLKLLKEDGYTEGYIHLFEDSNKLQEFKIDLEKVKEILHELIFILDFDETGLIFSTSKKENEIKKYIDQLLHLIKIHSRDAIDKILMDLYCSLLYFNKTITYSLNFIKYKINDTFNNYLEKSLE